jgi:hypothetical protein
MVARRAHIDSLTQKLAYEYPYAHEGISLKAIIKLVLWVILRSREYTEIKEKEE